ncbi:hypothetical protein ACF0H5_003270 [Mactra antiquata]
MSQQVNVPKQQRRRRKQATERKAQNSPGTDIINESTSSATHEKIDLNSGVTKSSATRSGLNNSSTNENNSLFESSNDFVRAVMNCNGTPVMNFSQQIPPTFVTPHSQTYQSNVSTPVWAVMNYSKSPPKNMAQPIAPNPATLQQVNLENTTTPT